MGPKCYVAQCIVSRKNIKIASFPWDFVTPLEEDRATAISNMHENFGKNRACGSGDMLAEKQTDTHRRAH